MRHRVGQSGEAQRAHELAQLRVRWGGQYAIGWDEEYVARRRDGAVHAFSPTASGLHAILEFDLSMRMTPPGQPGS